jgi:hypothetical protein
MALMRAARIAAIAIALPYLARLSQRVGEASGNPPVEGLHWALGALAVLFLVRAAATEATRGPEATGSRTCNGASPPAAPWRPLAVGSDRRMRHQGSGCAQTSQSTTDYAESGRHPRNPWWIGCFGHSRQHR